MSGSRSRPQRAHHAFDNHRSRLFQNSTAAAAEQGGSSGVSAGRSPAAVGAVGGAFLQEENEERISGLSGKVDVLKQITLNIGETIREQNKMFAKMESDFGKTETMLSGTLRQLKTVAQTRNGQYLFYLIFFAMGVIVFVYLYTRFY